MYPDPEEINCLNEFHSLKYQRNMDGVALRDRILDDLSGRAHAWRPQCFNRNEAVEMQWVPQLVRVPEFLIVGIHHNGSKLPIERKLRFDLDGHAQILLLRGVI
jgi:hypothetical protein